ncbi:plasmid mobilization protein [Methylobacterium sp. JK268]
MKTSTAPLLVAFQASPSLAEKIEAKAAEAGLSIAEYVRRLVVCAVTLYPTKSIAEFHDC